MGLKRKASSLECDYAFHQQQQPSSPPSMTFSSTTSSPDSMITEPFHTTSTYHLPITTNAPWLNSRTRKRVRDNRPDESQIHSDTVRKLFEAQKPHLPQEDAMMMDSDDFYQNNSLPTPPMDVEEEMAEDPANEDASAAATADLLVPEANQRSLHDFFRRQQPHQQVNVFPLTPPAVVESTVPLYTQQILFTTRPPTQQEIAAGAPAPVLRQRSSMGVLGEINTPPPSRDEQQDPSEGQSTFAGGVLACGFRSKVEIEAGLFGGIGVDVASGADAMVMG
ncbi:uncharacterized protein AB675_3457 [Cyphellophora attinorum]|uniref:Uncharacterized protein n=1 Tax=Cyphellophora attinorum TaxID=1664694 RepID=A0A0N1HAN6_9EURO|nr:uncharacterized protein AB675_3457 [Phialophora attinorum]KPI39817.1 hypothetical protein AB675_3457 [Phialophora attinorum]